MLLHTHFEQTDCEAYTTYEAVFSGEIIQDDVKASATICKSKIAAECKCFQFSRTNDFLYLLNAPEQNCTDKPGPGVSGMLTNDHKRTGRYFPDPSRTRETKWRPQCHQESRGNCNRNFSNI